ncbi:hypothetical protein QBC43DRAFT_284117 [Cladorrhinum sp. PSN259]|nr:hypothetical protein QBC43DRAFT_284117 [Cladorrhinum sp. PSN259]
MAGRRQEKLHQGRTVRRSLCRPELYQEFSNREGEPPFEALQSNIVALQQKGALITVGATTAPLPQTILDAIRITNLLGERYLWVDRLCIVQD